MSNQINKNKYLGVIFYFIYFFSLGCHSNNVNYKDAQIDSTNTQIDSSKKQNENDTPKIIKSSSSINVDSLPSEEFDVFQSYFKKDSKNKIPTNSRIPYRFVIGFLKSEIPDTASTFYSGIRPVFQLKNKNGNFYIIELKCTAGGDCGTFFLLNFDHFGKFIGSKEIGKIATEESESQIFKYKVISDTILVTFQIRYDNDLDKAIDTIKRKINLKNEL